jgi:hypothetical protein
MQEQGKWLLIVGVTILLIGVIFYFWGNKLSWIGNLPGDIRIERENFKFYFPITTMVILSIVLNLVFKLYQKFGG